MPLRVSNLRLPIDEPDLNLPAHLARALGVPPADLSHWRIVRKALDVRDKRHLRFVYNFEVEVPDAGTVTPVVPVAVEPEPVRGCAAVPGPSS